MKCLKLVATSAIRPVSGTRRWLSTFSGSRNHIHIINLEKTVAKLAEAEKFAHDLAAKGGKILFVDTKRGGREIIAAEAQRAGMSYVDRRWLGGTLTNFKTVKNTLKHLKKWKTPSLKAALRR